MSAKGAAIRRERKERWKAENRKAPDEEYRRAGQQGRIDGRTLAACIIINILYDRFGFRDKNMNLLRNRAESNTGKKAVKVDSEYYSSLQCKEYLIEAVAKVVVDGSDEKSKVERIAAILQIQLPQEG